MRRIIVTIGGVILVLAVVVAVWFFILRPRTLVTDESQNGISAVGTLPQSGNQEGQAGSGVGSGGVFADGSFSEEVQRKELTSKSRIFIERIGSYSSDSTLSNMTDLYSEMTDNLRIVAEANKNRIEQELSLRTNFIGYTVIPVSIVVEEIDTSEGIGRVNIVAQREITNELDTVSHTQENYTIVWQRQDDGKWKANEFTGSY